MAYYTTTQEELETAQEIIDEILNKLGVPIEQTGYTTEKYFDGYSGYMVGAIEEIGKWLDGVIIKQLKNSKKL